MKKTMWLLVGLLVAGTLALSSCKKDVNNLDCTLITYSGSIQPLVASNCNTSGCHNSGSRNGDFTSYDKIKGIATNGTMRSVALVRMSMPQGRSLSSEELNQVECWLDNGAPND